MTRTDAPEDVSAIAVAEPPCRIRNTINKEEPMAHQPEADIFDTIYRFRMVALTSPLWMAAVMILLNTYGGEQIRATIQFLTASPLR
jgi:hypothetical protein